MVVVGGKPVGDEHMLARKRQGIHFCSCTAFGEALAIARKKPVLFGKILRQQFATVKWLSANGNHGLVIFAYTHVGR